MGDTHAVQGPDTGVYMESYSYSGYEAVGDEVHATGDLSSNARCV